MEKIKKYIEIFFSKHEWNIRYSMTVNEACVLKEYADEKPLDALSTTFEYGYAKGYKAALAEMKKGGAVSA